MGSLGIFVIKNDEDEREMNNFIESTGNPDVNFSEFIDISRNLACHFFIHPAGHIVWFGYSENYRLPSGNWSSDSTFCKDLEPVVRRKRMQI
jgi:hypothetical protein